MIHLQSFLHICNRCRPPCLYLQVFITLSSKIFVQLVFLTKIEIIFTELYIEICDLLGTYHFVIMISNCSGISRITHTYRLIFVFICIYTLIVTKIQQVPGCTGYKNIYIFYLSLRTLYPGKLKNIKALIEVVIM